MPRWVCAGHRRVGDGWRVVEEKEVVGIERSRVEGRGSRTGSWSRFGGRDRNTQTILDNIIEWKDGARALFEYSRPDARPQEEYTVERIRRGNAINVRNLNRIGPGDSVARKESWTQWHRTGWSRDTLVPSAVVDVVSWCGVCLGGRLRGLRVQEEADGGGGWG